MIKEDRIRYIRQFNREYTGKIGLLEKHVYDTQLSFSESRILMEIDRVDECKSKNIADSLNMDAAFVSRGISRLIKLNLVVKTKSTRDHRAFILDVTEEGHKVLSYLHNKADQQIAEWIEDLDDEDQESIVSSISTLNALLLSKKEKVTELITIRHELRPGDLGELIALHGKLYSKECGYNLVFEAYVCKTFYEAIVYGDGTRDKYWIAECNGEIVGSIAIIAKDNDRCQLRWLLVHPEFRSIGLGLKLFKEAMVYAGKGGFKRIFLETTLEQERAIKFYKREGFIEKSSSEINDWGKNLTALVMEKELVHL